MHKTHKNDVPTETILYDTCSPRLRGIVVDNEKVVETVVLLPM